jgi:hypothetical protein
MNLAVSNTLVDLLLGLPKKDWNGYLLDQVRKQETEAQERLREREAKRQHGTHPSRELGAYAGSYEEPAYGTAEVAFENGGLVLRWSTFSCPLTHYHYDTFIAGSDILGNPPVVFTLDAAGEVATMKVLDQLDVEFKRVKPKPQP